MFDLESSERLFIAKVVLSSLKERCVMTITQLHSKCVMTRSIASLEFFPRSFQKVKHTNFSCIFLIILCVFLMSKKNGMVSERAY